MLKELTLTKISHLEWRLQMTASSAVEFVGTQVAKKSITIEMAHRLPNHEGKCRGLHGHSWQITVGVVGKPKGVIGTSDEGMIVDFTVLKGALIKIDRIFDHATVLANYDPLVPLLRMKGDKEVNMLHVCPGLMLCETKYGPLLLVPYAPTSENLAKLWGEIIIDQLPKLKIISVAVKETASSEVTWYPQEEL